MNGSKVIDPSIPILIPAYQPSSVLVTLVEALRAEGVGAIIVVNDGSAPECSEVFQKLQQIPEVCIVEHARNLGKGAALKTGFNCALLNFPELLGVITVDADGQHSPKDTASVLKRFRTAPTSLVLGVREFKDPGLVPWRSRFGNTLTRKIFRLVTGAALADTQTGLRAIPKKLLAPLLGVSASGYEFETDMLLLAIRNRVPLVQHGIETVYIDGNSSSHFNPLVDSLKIYFVLLRFALNSVFTGAIDFATFAITQHFGASILFSSVSGRIVAGSFNFFTAKRFVFHSRDSFWKEFAKYVALVAVLLFVSNSSISALVRRLDMNVYLAKLLVESSLFLLSFSAQKTFIFNGEREEPAATDWNAYYEKPFRATSVTRNVTIGRILEFLSPYAAFLNQKECIELGGGNSCVYTSLRAHFKFASYQIVDSNELGVALFKKRATDPNDGGRVGNILDPHAMAEAKNSAALCLSIGLIEHFDPRGTASAIESHFRCVPPDGLVLITYPTPTWLYRATRGIAELLGVWKFHDERPLRASEVVAEVERYGSILRHEVIWPIFLTQGIILCKKHGRKQEA